MSSYYTTLAIAMSYRTWTDLLCSLDDEVSKVANAYTSAKALYTTNKDIIDGAWSAMASATGAGRTIDDWIGMF